MKKESTTQSNYYVGKRVLVPAGVKVTSRGKVTTRKTNSIVTVRSVKTTQAGNVKIEWKSCGYTASAILKKPQVVR